MEQNFIVAEMVQSNKSNNLVWHVHVKDSSNPEHEGFCSKAGKAIRLAFLLKGRTGLFIDGDSLERLMWHNKEDRAAAQTSEPATESETEPAEEPETVTDPDGSSENNKKQRSTRRTKKEAA
ncbi:MAG: hypothetical protein IJQ44_08240 [Bacteroidaceae bacterium]|nr:hypothetical protein [Bacteroidaceae bacterium]